MKQTVIIVLAIVGMAVLIAVSVGVALGIRGTVHRVAGSVICHPPGSSTNTGPETAPDKDDKDDKDESSSKHRSGNYRMAAVQARDEVCAQIGMDVIVGRGGSAVDAAVATMFCIGSTLFQASGIGGGHFMIVYDKDRGSDKKTINTFLAREVLPLAGYKEYYLNHSSVDGGSAVGVPGTLHGLYTAWKMYGRVPWRDLVVPSIKLCEGGFMVHKTLKAAIDFKNKYHKTFNINLRNAIQKPDGAVYEVGDIMKRPLFARTLKIIADDPMSFYNGSLADDVIADVNETGGEMVKEDLLRYQTRIRKPVTGRLRSLGLTMYAPEPPSSGVVLEYLLRLCDGFGFNKDSLKDSVTMLKTYQQIIEAFKFAFGRRSALGDPFFWNISQVVQNMTDDAYINRIRSKIDTTSTHDLDYYEHLYGTVEDGGTSHISVLAPDGSAVSLTASVNYYFGSSVYGSRTGILFNNEMDDFSIPGKSNIFNIAASPSNFPEPGKMPMSSMSPIIFLTDSGEVAYISGATGGPRIISSIAYVALHNLYLGLDMTAAVDRPRLHHQLLPNEIRCEDGFDEDVLQGLRHLNHKLVKVYHNGNVGVIRNLCAYGCVPGDDDCMETCIHAVADLRSDGSVYGY